MSLYRSNSSVRKKLLKYVVLYSPIYFILIVFRHLTRNKIGMLVALTLGALLIYLVYIAESDTFHPFAIVGLGYTLAFLAPGIDLYLSSPDNPILSTISPEALFNASVVILTGVIFMIIGYNISFGVSVARVIPTFPTTWDSQRAWYVIFLFSAIGVSSYLTFFIISGLPTTLAEISQKRTSPSAYLNWGVRFLWFALIIAAADIFENKYNRWKTFTAILLLFLNSSFYFLISQRTNFVYVFITILILAHYLRHSFSIKRLSFIAAPLLLVLAFMSALRKGAWRGSSNVSIIEYVLPIKLLDVIFGANYGGLVIVAHLVEMVPQKIDYQLGVTLVQWVVFPIPRSMWGNKPVQPGSWLATEVYGFSWGTPPTLVGELYLNFGLIGVLFGMLSLGIITRIVYSYLYSRSLFDPATVVIYTALITNLTTLSDTSPKMILLLQWLIPTVPALIYISQWNTPHLLLSIINDKFLQSATCVRNSVFIGHSITMLLVLPDNLSKLSFHFRHSVFYKLFFPEKRRIITAHSVLSSSVIYNLISDNLRVYLTSSIIYQIGIIVKDKIPRVFLRIHR